jgi:hypothetical protein
MGYKEYLGCSRPYVLTRHKSGNGERITSTWFPGLILILPDVDVVDDSVGRIRVIKVQL